MKNRQDLDKKIEFLRQDNARRRRILFPKSFKNIDQKKAFENGLALGKLVSLLMARSGGRNPFSKRGMIKILTSTASFYLTSYLKRKIR